MLEARGLSPRHRFGQNFLHDHNVLTKLVDAANIQKGDLVLEVGPGTGTLTETLLDRGCTVVACELDRGLAELLEERLGDSIKLIRGDCLVKRRLNQEVVEALGDRPWKLVANLPYQIASPLIVDLLVHHPNCMGEFVTIQLEVAQRLMAKVDSESWGVLSILTQRLADVSLIAKAPPTCFWPAPKVTSACVSVVRRECKAPKESESFARFVTKLFSKRRKQLGSILGRERELPNAISLEARPSTLTIAQLELLWSMYG
ncbi:MAG: 16S rRNA (adenine(1518)-N(6)/adenine(1519)-N(6))-dimethyltransferase RsmA [Phycisphaerales bacterium]|jgi:16S rRNA (adenine1518-N6/adenine1519-N6)-dimethyltransferase|nr:16S rRNA (adenine(1518)-N(6)/adenine(1519)-N(6))-dimethyltransferase RsmA [Phycisphaerales bacterium]